MTSTHHVSPLPPPPPPARAAQALAEIAYAAAGAWAQPLDPSRHGRAVSQLNQNAVLPIPSSAVVAKYGSTLRRYPRVLGATFPAGAGGRESGHSAARRSPKGLIFRW